MFKRLRERIAEEAIKFPVSQLNSNSGKQLNETENKASIGNSTEDLITLSDSSAVVVPHTSSQQFSIGEDEDGSMSEQNTPQKKQNESYNGSTSEQSFYTPARDGPTNSASDFGYGPQYRPSKSHYIPQSDIESEREDPPTLNLESISKDQLLTIIDMLKAKAYKYKNKYSEVVKNYKELRDEKLKIENTLIEHQDKSLRRIGELREQCQLEQKAKAHLEANLRLLLEEKDSMISVLETQINLLKRDQSMKFTSDSNEYQTSDASSGDIQVEDNASLAQDISAQQEKIERLEHQFSQAKKTITAQTDQISLLRKQNEGLSQELEEKIKALNEMEDELGNLKSQHEFILKSMQGRLEELENQQEESLMSMAETKKNMHEELEFKEKQLKKAEKEAKQFQIACESERSKVTELQKQHENKINELQRQLESTEKMLEEEKENLMQELGRGKSAAITLMQQECATKIASIEEEWKAKLKSYESEKNHAEELQIKEAKKKALDMEEKLKLSEPLVEKLNAHVIQLKKENTALKSSLEKLDSDFAFTSEKLEKLQVDYKDLKESKEKESLDHKEKFKQELSDRIHSYQQSEIELQTLCCCLKEQLNEKQIVIDDIVHTKNALCLQIDGLEKNEKELKAQSEVLKNEVKQFCSKLQDLTCELGKVMESNGIKSQEILELQEQVKQFQFNEKADAEKLLECKKGMEDLIAENKRLMLKISIMCEDFEKLENKLQERDEKINSLNNMIDNATLEINLLNKCLVEKQEMFEHLAIDLVKIDNALTKLEGEDDCTRASISKYDAICDKMSEKVIRLTNVFESKHIKDLFSVQNASSVIAMDKNSEDSLTENDESNQSASMKEETNQVKIIESSEKCDFTSSNIVELQSTIHKLLDENRKLKQEIHNLKELSEIQNIEFAKNITHLHESLNQLQDERNNLSLVLQSFETQIQGENSQSDKHADHGYDKGKIASDSMQLKKTEHRIDLMELNCKVKCEIAALSAQTELVNTELKNLKDQFNVSQSMYSDKVMELNAKLMRRTEKLLSVKEALDHSIMNNDTLKDVLENTQKQLDDKSELLTSYEKSKQDLENKFKNLQEKYVQKELSMKQQHNSQLSDLKNQTKATIEKLNEEIQKANLLLKGKEDEFSLELTNVKEYYNQEMGKSLENHKEFLQLENMIEKLSNASLNFETDYFKNLNTMDSFSSKIAKLNTNFNKVVLKLHENESLYSSQQIKIKNLQDQNQFVVQENKDLQFHLNEITEGLNVSKKKLKQEKELKDIYQHDLNVLKENHESAVKQLESSCTLNEAEKVELKKELDKSTSEISTIQTKYKEVCCSLEQALNELQNLKSENIHYTDLQQKYDTLLTDLENIKSSLEKEKETAAEASCEWRTLCNKIIHDFNDSASNSLEQLQIITLKLNEKEAKLKQFESLFAKTCATFKSQKLDIFELKNEIEKLVDANQSLVEEIHEQSASSEEKSKLEVKIKEITESKMALSENLQCELNEAKAKLETSEANNQLQTNEVNRLQEQLDKCSESQLETETNYELKSKKLAEVEKLVVEWEQKYKKAQFDVKNAYEAAKVVNDKLQASLKQIESKNVLIASMVPIEKVEECKHVHAIEVDQLNSLISNLKEQIHTLCSDLKEKEAAVKKSQLEQENVAIRQDENLKCVKDKLENAEKNYATQMNEMKSRLSLLEKEKYALESEKAELLKVQEKLSDLKNGESAIKSELQLKEDELRKLQQKYETSNKDQVQKIQNFQETMKDKENMIVKLKTNIASITKENLEKNEEFKKKIKALEEERELLMIQAQERVSTTEAKCREDIKALQEKNYKLLADNKEMEKSRNRCIQLEKDLSEIRLLSESQRVIADKEITQLKEQLIKAEENLSASEKAKHVLEVELSGKVNKLQEENSLLLGKSNHFESLKAEKEELNEKLKQAEQQVTSVKQLEDEKDALKKENAAISLELEQLRSTDTELEEKIKSLEESEIESKSEIKKLQSTKENLESEITALKNSFETERNSLVLEKENLLKQIDLLEKSEFENSENTSLKNYIESMRNDCENAMRAKEEEMDLKLKHLLRDLSIQMDIKDKDCDKIMAEIIEKSQVTEDRLVKEHRSEIASLRQSMFERECALDEMRDHYEETLQEKEKKLKELQLTIKKLTESTGSIVSNDSALLTAESSDWDDTWAVPDECIENTSPVHNTEPCKEHLLQIESLQDELSKCNSEIKELKILLRLSPPESMVNNNNRRDSLQSLPEPTEFEYLKNIIYEYMMGKEPITLAKVIAAVLRFSDSQTQQVIRREEAKHPTR